MQLTVYITTEGQTARAMPRLDVFLIPSLCLVVKLSKS